MTTRTLATEIAMATFATKVATSIASIAMKPVVVVAPSVTTNDGIQVSLRIVPPNLSVIDLFISIKSPCSLQIWGN
jgi:hypothetical protein